VLAALAAIALLTPAPAAAKCAQLSESESREVSDVVFEGVVGGHLGEGGEAEATPGKPAEAVLRFRDFRFRVARYLQGNGPDNVAVKRLLIPGGFPVTDPRPGEAWRVYARRDSSGRLRFSACVPYSERLEGAAADRVREQLAGGGAAEDGDGGGDAEDDGGGPSILALALALLAAAGLGVAYLARRR